MNRLEGTSPPRSPSPTQFTCAGLGFRGEGDEVNGILISQGRRGRVLRPLLPWAINLAPLFGALLGMRASCPQLCSNRSHTSDLEVPPLDLISDVARGSNGQ